MIQLGYEATEKEIEELIENLNPGKLEINYTQFLTATLDKKIFLQKERLWDAFKYFDIDNSNYITKENL